MDLQRVGTSCCSGRQCATAQPQCSRPAAAWRSRRFRVQGPCVVPIASAQSISYCSRSKTAAVRCEASTGYGLDTSSSAAAGPQVSEFQRLFNQIPFQKIAIWAAVAAFCYQLKDFFGIAMGAFVMSFIGNSFVESAQDSSLLTVTGLDRPGRRRALVGLYFFIIVAVVSMFGILTIPDIAREGADFVSRLKSDNVWVVLVEKMRTGLGDQVMDSLERVVMLATSNDLRAAAAEHGQDWTADRSIQLGTAVSKMLKPYTTTAAQITAGMLTSITKFALQTGVSLVLAFMLVWDMPAISTGVSELASSRLAPIYNEVAPSLAVFGKLFGKALEAQARIALANTVMTAAGMWLLKIPGIGLLSLFVFVCSFIPIAGVIISTTPIGFVALTEYGFMTLALVILMVFLVHFVEAYLLNPAIYSAHLKLHPLLVLSVLVIAEHNLGIWGLLLAVPLTVFALDYCIRYPESSVTEVGKKELKLMDPSREGVADDNNDDEVLVA